MNEEHRRPGWWAASAAGKTWRKARDVERVVARALGSGTSFMEWLVLETIDELSDREGEDVRQRAIADETGLSRNGVSYWMRVLEEAGFVNRGEHMDGRCWSVLLSSEGKQKLEHCRQRLEGFRGNG